MECADFISALFVFLVLILVEMFKFEVPSLTVGTLDTLMTLSDELVKTDSVVEQTVRKIERTTGELFGGKAADLTVGGKIWSGFGLALGSMNSISFGSCLTLKHPIHFNKM